MLLCQLFIQKYEQQVSVVSDNIVTFVVFRLDIGAPLILSTHTHVPLVPDIHCTGSNWPLLRQRATGISYVGSRVVWAVQAFKEHPENATCFRISIVLIVTILWDRRNNSISFTAAHFLFVPWIQIRDFPKYSLAIGILAITSIEYTMRFQSNLLFLKDLKTEETYMYSHGSRNAMCW